MAAARRKAAGLPPVFLIGPCSATTLASKESEAGDISPKRKKSTRKVGRGMRLKRERGEVNSSYSMHKIEASRVGKRSKITVPREEENASIDAGLCNQSVSEARPASPC